MATPSTAQKITSTQLLQTSEAWNGTPYETYPEGTPQLTVMKMSIPPHASLPWHSHPVPNMAYLLSGELTIEDKESGQTHKVKAGEALNESVGDIHRGYTTEQAAELVIFYAGASGLALSEPLPGEPSEF